MLQSKIDSYTVHEFLGQGIIFEHIKRAIHKDGREFALKIYENVSPEIKFILSRQVAMMKILGDNPLIEKLYDYNTDTILYKADGT